MKLYAVFYIIFSLLSFGMLSTVQAQEPIAPKVLETPEVSVAQLLFAVKMDKHVERATINYLITITANAEDISIGTTAVVAHVKDSAGGSKLHALKPNVNAQGQKIPLWVLTVTPEKSARYVINLRVNSKNKKGKRISETLPAQYFTYPSPDDPIVYPENDELTLLRKEVAREVADVPRENSEKESYGASKEREDDSIINVAMTDETQDDNGSMSWPVMGAIGAGIIAFLALLFFLYRRFMAKRKERSGDEGENEDGAASEGGNDKGASQDGEKAPSGKDNEKTKSAGDKESQGDSIDIGDEDPLSELDAVFNMETESTEDLEIDDVEIEVDEVEVDDVEIEVDEVEVEDVEIEVDEVEVEDVEIEVDEVEVDDVEIEVDEVEVEELEVEEGVEGEEAGSGEDAVELDAESATKKENDT